MSSKGKPFVTSNGRDELKEMSEIYTNRILAKAWDLALKDGRPYIDKTYIEKASRQIHPSSNAIAWTLRILLLIVFPIIITLQITSLLLPEVLAFPIGLQISLWLLPIFSICFIMLLSRVFWGFIS
ncbi:MAG TPA: hypothetical protein ENN36_03210 [Candidatus Bathyarchaeota archaeon]|nr:hypothetical protein [Candidatus Bathyarchaeota archaeon]